MVTPARIPPGKNDPPDTIQSLQDSCTCALSDSRWPAQIRLSKIVQEYTQQALNYLRSTQIQRDKQLRSRDYCNHNHLDRRSHAQNQKGSTYPNHNAQECSRQVRNTFPLDIRAGQQFLEGSNGQPRKSSNFRDDKRSQAYWAQAESFLPGKDALGDNQFCALNPSTTSLLDRAQRLCYCGDKIGRTSTASSTQGWHRRIPLDNPTHPLHVLLRNTFPVSKAVSVTGPDSRNRASNPSANPNLRGSTSPYCTEKPYYRGQGNKNPLGTNKDSVNLPGKTNQAVQSPKILPDQMNPARQRLQGNGSPPNLKDFWRQQC